MTSNAAATSSRRDPLLAAAGRGEADAFARLVEPYRAELHVHCYRMLGSPHDAEDALQDALLRAWRGVQGVRERAALRAWLYRVATNSCHDAIKRRPARMLPIESMAPLQPEDDPGEPAVEVPWVEPYPDELLGLEDGRAAPEARYEQREAVELAFVAALQHLPPAQRTALILRDVLGFSAREASEALNTTVASVNSALQRARKTIHERLPARSQQATLRALGDSRARNLVQALMDAWQRADIETVAALLADDATFSMPPYASWWRGRSAITALIARLQPSCPPSQSVSVHANGQAALGCYLWDREWGAYRPGTLTVFDLDGALVKNVVSFVLPELFPRFRLPEQLARQ
jgi:RNA polymerase sigma-70 factor (ECF subfamily)